MHQSMQRALEMHQKSMEFDMQGRTLTQASPVQPILLLYANRHPHHAHSMTLQRVISTPLWTPIHMLPVQPHVLTHLDPSPTQAPSILHYHLLHNPILCSLHHCMQCCVKPAMPSTT